MSDSEVIGERRLTAYDVTGKPAELVLQVRKPVSHSNGAFGSSYDVVGLLPSKPREAAQSGDSWGAINQAMRAASAEVVYYCLPWGPLPAGKDIFGVWVDPDLIAMCQYWHSGEFGRAIALAPKLAEDGWMPAQFMLGIAHYFPLHGLTLPTDVLTAASWLKKAATAGSPNACDALATLYRTGALKPTPFENAAYFEDLALQYGWPHSDGSR